jgi:hypothetical protein
MLLSCGSWLLDMDFQDTGAVECDSEVLLHNKLEAILEEAEGSRQRLAFRQVQLLEVE